MAKKRRQATQDDEVRLDQAPETVLDSTTDFEIFIEPHLSNRSLSGLDLGYGVRNKNTKVVEMRWGAYSEAIQGLMVLQENYDKYMSIYNKKHRGN